MVRLLKGPFTLMCIKILDFHRVSLCFVRNLELKSRICVRSTGNVISSISLFSESCYQESIGFWPNPSKNVTFACSLELLLFFRYFELCVHIFRRDLSGPETHESGEISTRVGAHGGTPTPVPRGDAVDLSDPKICTKPRH